MQVDQFGVGQAYTLYWATTGQASHIADRHSPQAEVAGIPWWDSHLCNYQNRVYLLIYLSTTLFLPRGVLITYTLVCTAFTFNKTTTTCKLVVTMPSKKLLKGANNCILHSPVAAHPPGNPPPPPKLLNCIEVVRGNNAGIVWFLFVEWDSCSQQNLPGKSVYRTPWTKIPKGGNSSHPSTCQIKLGPGGCTFVSLACVFYGILLLQDLCRESYPFSLSNYILVSAALSMTISSKGTTRVL